MDFDFKLPALDIHTLIHDSRLAKPYATQELEQAIADGSMYDLYKLLVEKNILKPNTNLLETLMAKKGKRLRELESLKQRDPDNENYVYGVDKQIAEFYAQTMDTKNAFDIMRVLMKDTASLSLKMDVFLCKIRISIILRNRRLLKESIELAEDVYSRGCDWDRRNKYKVYKAIFCLMKMKFKDAAVLLSETLPSFESPELTSYSKAVTYMVFCGLLTFSRRDISGKILESSEVLSSNEKLGLELTRSLFDCVYGDFMHNLYLFSESIKDDVFLCNFVDLFCKEMKLRAYSQVLESYQSMSIVAMANTFGVEVGYIEKDVSRFIVDGRLGCKIDRVSGVVRMSAVSEGRAVDITTAGGDLVRKIKKYIK